VIDSWKRIEACDCNKEVNLDCAKEDDESHLPERLRNLSVTPNDVGRMGLTAREAEELP
jgi:hypothetical protein